MKSCSMPFKGHGLMFKRGVKTPTIDWKPIITTFTNLNEKEVLTHRVYLRRFFYSLMIAMPVVSFALGCWQVQRLKWKVDLISKSEKLLAKPPMPSLPLDLDPQAVKDFEFRRFKLKGHFIYSQEMFLGPRIRNGETGYLVIVPFKPSDGGEPILVERGWIAKDKVIPETRQNNYLSHLSFPQGEIEIQAFFRNMPPRSNLQFSHEDGNKLFFIPDVEAMAKQSGSSPVYCQVIYDMTEHPEYKKSLRSWFSWFKSNKPNIQDPDFKFEYQEFEFVRNGVPIGTIPNVNFTNNHLQYLVTWFGLSIASTGLLAYHTIKSKNLKSAESLLKAKQRDMKKNW